MRTDILTELYEENLDVGVWTVKNQNEYRQLSKAGVDSVITDNYSFLDEK